MKLLEKITLYIFVFVLPFNIKKFITNPTQTEPLIEFSALFLYLTDVLVIFLLVLWLIRTFRSPKNLGRIARALKEEKMKIINKVPLWGVFLIGFLFVSILTSFSSQNLTLSIYFLIKLLLCIGFFSYLKNNLKKNNFLNFLKIISLGGLIQSLIALVQFLKQSSLGLKYLGESVIVNHLPGVANIDIVGTKFIRSYGTFAHPNILAVFLLLTLYCSIWLVIKKKGPFLFTIPFLVLGLILTFSRSVLLLGSVSIIFFLLFSFIKTKNKYILKPLLVFVVSLIVLILSLSSLLSQRINLNSDNQAVSLRAFYNTSAIEIIKKSPLTGVGLGSFSSELRKIYPDLENWQYQPAHNIYLLIDSEVGILGLITFLLFLIFFLKKHASFNEFFVLFVVFIFLGLVDHYFFTINQGMLVFWLTLGLISFRMKISS
jgi:putative inorganic carbon (hco3(-)) transporter